MDNDGHIIKIMNYNTHITLERGVWYLVTLTHQLIEGPQLGWEGVVCDAKRHPTPGGASDAILRKG